MWPCPDRRGIPGNGPPGGSCGTPARNYSPPTRIQPRPAGPALTCTWRCGCGCTGSTNSSRNHTARRKPRARRCGAGSVHLNTGTGSLPSGPPDREAGRPSPGHRWPPPPRWSWRGIGGCTGPVSAGLARPIHPEVVPSSPPQVRPKEAQHFRVLLNTQQGDVPVQLGDRPEKVPEGVVAEGEPLRDVLREEAAG